jgi:hypothetical protein
MHTKLFKHDDLLGCPNGKPTKIPKMARRPVGPFLRQKGPENDKLKVLSYIGYASGFKNAQVGTIEN